MRGWSVPFLFVPCVFWDRPPVTLRTPTGSGVPPVLMVQSVRDPATPVEGARRAHAGFAGSRLLTVNDEGDHGIYAFTANACVNDAVEAYLVDGVVPAVDFSCPGTPLPDPTAPGTLTDAATPSEQVANYRKITGPLPL